jgi:hypothetical protein
MAKSKCKRCQKDLEGKQRKFCSDTCRHVHRNTSEVQYSHISGNWPKYLNRLCHSTTSDRKGLTKEDLMEVLEKQDYKCALSGLDLTCKLEIGIDFPTNASIDRIQAGGPYIKENIQFVCKALNFFRKNTTVDEFIWWCKKVAEYNG